MELTTYRARAGRAIPSNCGDETKIYVFFFGSETQKVLHCARDEEVIKSEDTALLNRDDDAIYSGQYKAYPARVDNKIIYNSVLSTKPILHEGYDIPG